MTLIKNGIFRFWLPWVYFNPVNLVLKRFLRPFAPVARPIPFNFWIG